MKSYKEYSDYCINEDMYVQNILEMLAIKFDNGDKIYKSIVEEKDISSDDIFHVIGEIDESFLKDVSVDRINKLLGNVGLKLSKRKGIIGHLMNAGKGIAKLFIFLIKKDIDSAKKVLEGLRKEDIVDFLLNLDMATMHLISGPIHMIDAWTGWDLWSNIKKTGKNIIDALKEAIKKVKEYLVKVYDRDKAVIYNKYISSMEKELKSLT